MRYVVHAKEVIHRMVALTADRLICRDARLSRYKCLVAIPIAAPYPLLQMSLSIVTQTVSDTYADIIIQLIRNKTSRTTSTQLFPHVRRVATPLR